MDHSQIAAAIRNQRDKLQRQEEAVRATKGMLELLEQQAEQLSKASGKQRP